MGQGGKPGAARRLPSSGIRPKPQGELFDGTAYIRRPRRIIGIMIVLLLIGIGVALGVAFSGPELDVVDPTVAGQVPPNPPAAAAGAPSGQAGSATGAVGAAPSGGSDGWRRSASAAAALRAAQPTVRDHGRTVGNSGLTLETSRVIIARPR